MNQYTAEKATIACLGRGSNGHQAANTFMEKAGIQGKLHFCKSHLHIFTRTMFAQEETYGVVPIENYKAGPVRENISFWIAREDDREWLSDGNRVKKEKDSLTAIAEIEIPIEHCLLGKPGTRLEEITKVRSHPQAIAQTTETLDELGIEKGENFRKSESSTARAAEIVAQMETGDTGAIAPKIAAQEYGLEILKSNLEDEKNNRTRFYIIGKRILSKHIDVTKYKTGLIFWLSNSPAALLNAISVMATAKVNMETLQSLPIGSKEQIAFYCEFEHVSEVISNAILALMTRSVDKLVSIGRFPVWEINP
jgi:prephenate dehydratase